MIFRYNGIKKCKTYFLRKGNQITKTDKSKLKGMDFIFMKSIPLLYTHGNSGKIFFDFTNQRPELCVHACTLSIYLSLVVGVFIHTKIPAFQGEKRLSQSSNNDT